MMRVECDSVGAKDLSKVKLLEKLYGSQEDSFIQQENAAKKIMSDWQSERSMREISKFKYNSHTYHGVEVLRFD